MKNLLKTTFALFIILLPIGLQAQSRPQINPLKGDLVVVRSFEAMVGSWGSKIEISDGIGETQTIELPKTRPNTSGENLRSVTQVLAEIKLMGYTLTQSNSAGASEAGVFLTNYVFEKQ